MRKRVLAVQESDSMRTVLELRGSTYQWRVRPEMPDRSPADQRRVRVLAGQPAPQCLRQQMPSHLLCLQPQVRTLPVALPRMLWIRH